jgi:beta-xylosidase
MNAALTRPSVASDIALNYASPWTPDCGNGTYCNPILYADYSDPDVVRVGDDFFMVASSFNCTPGLPILHSKDLVNWKIIGHALKNLPHPRYEKVQPGCGVWAPAIRFHKRKFWIFFSTPDEGIFLVTAKHPAGPWSEPHCVQAGKGLIDPCPLWDDDGKAYLVHAYAGSRAGIKHRLRVCPMAPDGSKLLGEGEIVFHQPEKHPTLEGPKFLKKDGWYYILAPAGGVETGWQLALRSKNIYGPYEEKIVLAQGGTDINGPHQGALVDTAVGGWWFVHFQDAGVYGRIVHLQPVEWQDGWPLMGKNGEPVRRHAKPIFISGQKPFAPQTSDEFDEQKLGLQWQWHANHHDYWHSLTARPGWLRLFPQMAVTPMNEQPNLLVQKFPARSFTAETALNFFPMQSGEETGLAVVGQSIATLGVFHDGNKSRVVFRVNNEKKLLAEMIGHTIKLRVVVKCDGNCFFSFVEQNKPVNIPQKFRASKGKWIGAKIGLYSLKQIKYAQAGHVDGDYFRFL